MVTVDLSHFRTADYKLFYEPNDDTWLFTDALEEQVDFIQRNVKPYFCLEVGSGSGYVTTFLHHLLKSVEMDCFFTCTDINPNAANATRRTLEQNGATAKVDVVMSSFFSAVLPRLENKIDILLFNPPYVPCEEEEMHHNDVHAAYAGGLNGREVIDIFLPLIQRALSPNGVCYMIAIEENKPQEIIEIVSKEEYGSLHGSVIKRKKVLVSNTQRPTKMRKSVLKSVEIKKRRKAARPAWDNTIHDLNVHRLNKQEIAQRKQSMVSKNLDIAREELENPSPVKRKQELQRPKSAPKSRVRTVSPIVTKTSSPKINSMTSYQFVSLDEEQFNRESMHSCDSDTTIDREEHSENFLVSQIAPIIKSSMDSDTISSLSADWSDSGNQIIDDKEGEEYVQHIEKLKTEYSEIASRIKFLEHESQLEQSRAQILQLEQTKSDLTSRVQQLEVDLMCSKGETDDVKKQFEQYKIENERIQADLRIQIKRLTEEKNRTDEERSLSSRIFKIESKYITPEEEQPSPNNDSQLFPITPRGELEHNSPEQLFEPAKPLFSLGTTPSPKQFSKVSIDRVGTPIRTNVPDGDISPYVTYVNRIPSPHPQPKHPLRDGAAFSQFYTSKKTASTENTPPLRVQTTTPTSADSYLSKQSSNKAVKTFMIKSLTPSPNSSSRSLSGLSSNESVKKKKMAPGVLTAGYSRSPLSTRNSNDGINIPTT